MIESLIYNFNCDCHKQYTNVSPLLGDELNNILEEIEHFFYSDFWITRFKRRLRQEKLIYMPLELDIVLGTTSHLKDNIKFKTFEDSRDINGISNNKNMIALNTNISKEKLNDSHINNVIMHEFGHRQYNEASFNIVRQLNKKIIGDPSKYIESELSENDIKYFTNDDELRQRIIPIIKEMRDNRWDLNQVYEKSHNLEIDSIKGIFKRGYILKLIDNLL